MKRLFVVGGGIAGLAAAWAARQADRSLEITLVERDALLGGKIRTDVVEGFLLEEGPDGFLSRKPALMHLAKDLGISARLIARPPRAVPASVMHSHILHPLPEGFSGMVPADLDALSKSTMLSESGKRRAMEEASIPAASGPEDESVARFMKRRYGEEAFHLLIEPLVSGIYAADADQLSMEATVPHLRALEKQKGSLTVALIEARNAARGTAPPPFLSFEAGMTDVVHALVKHLAGVCLLRGCEARSIAPRGDSYVMSLSDGSERLADAVILSVPSREAALLTRSFAPVLAEVLDSIPFSSSAIVHLAFHEGDVAHPLDGYGYLIPAVEGSALLGCTWSSRKWAGRAPEGTLLMRMHVGRYGRAEVLEKSDDELVRLCRDELAATLGITAQPILTRVHRWDLGLPQYNAGHLERLASIDRLLVIAFWLISVAFFSPEAPIAASVFLTASSPARGRRPGRLAI